MKLVYAVRGAEFDKLYDQLPPKLKEYIEERELDEQFPLKAAQKNPARGGWPARPHHLTERRVDE